MSDIPNSSHIVPFGVEPTIRCHCGKYAVHDHVIETYPSIDVYICRNGHLTEVRRTLADEERIKRLNPPKLVDWWDE